MPPPAPVIRTRCIPFLLGSQTLMPPGGSCRASGAVSIASSGVIHPLSSRSPQDGTVRPDDTDRKPGQTPNIDTTLSCRLLAFSCLRAATQRMQQRCEDRKHGFDGEHTAAASGISLTALAKN